MSKHKFTILLVLSTLVAACSAEEETTKSETIRPVKTVTLVEEVFENQRSYPAIVLPSRQAELSFRTPGQILELPVKAADEVKEDDIIAKLDTRDFEAQVAALESQLEQAKAQLDGITSGARVEDIASLQANIAAAEAQVTVAREQLNRSQTLFDKGIIAKAKLDTDQANLNVALANLEASRQELIKGETGGRREDVAAQVAVIKGIEANLNSARDSLNNATLRAPFDGIIANRAVDNFANIQANQTIVTLQRIENLELSFDIPGPDVAKIDRENPPSLQVVLDSLPDQILQAEFAEFNTIANSTTQTFTGRVSIDQPQGATILPGMTGLVLVTAEIGEKKSLMINGTAIASEPDGSAFVWVVENDLVSKRTVSLGAVSGERVAVENGLESGEIVVIAGVTFLQEGMKVRTSTGEE